jgi:hypothetical protein
MTDFQSASPLRQIGPRDPIKTYFRFNLNTSQAEVSDDQGVLVWSVDFPMEFVASREPRWIEVVSANNIIRGAMNEDYFFCSDFVERDAYLDSQVCPTNRWFNSRRVKYSITSRRRRMRFWFSDISGVRRNVDAFSITLLLTY